MQAIAKHFAFTSDFKIYRVRCHLCFVANPKQSVNDFHKSNYPTYDITHKNTEIQNFPIFFNAIYTCCIF